MDATERECAFEPEVVEVLCADCEKPTGLMGTCNDLNFCASCKTDFIDVAVAVGATQAQAEAEYSEMLITLIEGAPYKAKYAPRRVMHFEVNGQPACGIKGGPHPMTTNRNETNCKRCAVKLAQGGKRD
jgi:hypothetical protein